MAASVIALVPPTWTTSLILSTPSHTWQRSLCLPASRSFTPRTREIPTSPPTSTGDQLLRLALVADKAMAAPPPTATEDLAIRSSTRTEAWFGGTTWKPVPVARVFGRIREALPATPTVETPTTCKQIEEALMRLELAAAAACTPGDDTLLPQPMSPAPLAASPPRHLEDLASDAAADKILPASLPGALLPQEMTLMPATPPPLALELGSLTESASSPCAIAGLFTLPPPAIIASPPCSTLPCLRPVVLTRKVKLWLRQHSQVTRRSERLAKQPTRPTMERCQRVLFRRLGILHDGEDASVERVLSQYMAMFDGPLPPHAIAALTAIFGLDYDDECAMDAALLPLMGEGITNVADEVEEMLA
nr:OSJNBa0038O10.5 [Oryza sativa Japonica Group]